MLRMMGDMAMFKLTVTGLTKRDGFATPSLRFCVCNHTCLTTKRYGRDYKSRPAAERVYSGLRCNGA